MTERRRLHVAFLPYPAHGHTPPMLPLVAEMVRRGHRVTCFTSPAFLERVEATGARPVLYGAELETRPAKDWFTVDEVCWMMTDLVNNTMAVAPGIDAEFAEDWPDVIAYDTTLWAPGRFTTWRARDTVVQMIATFASNEHFSMAADGGKVAGEGGTDPGEIDPNHPGLVELGRLLDKFSGDYGVPADAIDGLLEGFDEFSLVFVPRELQPAGDTFGDSHVFVGSLLSESSADQGWRPPANGRPVVLVSLGTTVNRGPEFFRDTMRAMADLPWHVVMTMGNKVNPDELGELPDNVEVHKWIPLDDVLRHASLLVCQGGMGTVLQSLWHGVPMIVVPHHGEQKLNADRLDELGLARVLSQEQVSPRALRELALELIDDTEMLRRVAKMRDVVRDSGGVRLAADTLEARATGGR
ncbi:macrolide family glycosyltransferase [Kutzneria sp. CA-103260]|uniref:macrolide family glycosyltransferase n=1 Tax=Kutzneria sp. CA-103260 TaxID=2802641 RepID=UPI001BA9225C|nr:macrolide family glycosyltransferase [Kutzneria sp. CA-103260]QUQ72342.1 glycosyl transferase [Kutzneria sp. CA-103260]